MAGEEDGFLQRWSRRKQQTARVAPAVEKPDPATEAARKAEADALEKRRLAEEETARAELLARLPRLEDLAADSDFRVFMHPLVPPALRSAALAKMWTLDPTIRDFVGPARDYAWNWNVPGGVPGGGPAPSLAEVEETLRKLLARLDRDEPAAANSDVVTPAPAAAGDDDAKPSPAPSGTPADRIGQAAAGARLGEGAAAPGAAEERSGPVADTMPPTSPGIQGPGGTVKPRRHGGATPA